jgi:hypothetical protein
VETPGTLSPTPLTSSVVYNYEDSRNREEEPDDPQPADEGDIQMEYSAVQPKQRNSDKKLLVRN